MTTQIKASCPCCGEVELTPPDVKLMVCSDAPLSYYSFICLTCKEEVRKPADDHVVSLLISGGVQAVVWEVPEEVRETKTGAPICEDDLIDFCRKLYRPSTRLRIVKLASQS